MKKLLAILAAVALAGCAQSPNAHVGANARLCVDGTVEAPGVNPYAPTYCNGYTNGAYSYGDAGVAPEASGPIYVYVKPAGGPELYH